MSKTIIQRAREALSHLESEAHSLGMRSEYRHELARQIRAGLGEAARAGKCACSECGLVYDHESLATQAI